MVVSQRKIKEILKNILPPGTHIRDGVLDTIQDIMAVKLSGVCNRIAYEAIANKPIVVTKDNVLQSYGQELLIAGGEDYDFGEIFKNV
jgi:hypothetical protein